MGQEILYCSRCQTRIVGGDFERGDAYRVGEQQACSRCAMEMLSKAPIEIQKQILEQKQKAIQKRESKSSPPKPAAAPRLATASSTQVRSSSAESTPSRAPMAALIGVGVTLVVLVGMLVMSKGSSAPPTPPPPSVSRPPVPPAPAPAPGPSAREIAAQGAFQVAASFAKDHPSDFDEQARLFERIAADYAMTPACADARKELERIARQRKDALAAELGTLLAKAREQGGSGDPQKAIDLLQRARKKHPEPEWIQPLEEKIQELENAAAASPAPAPTVPKPNGNLMLRVADATVVGTKIKRIGQGDWSLLQTWNDARDYVEWTVVLPQAGTYTLHLNYACPKEFSGKPFGGEFSFLAGEQAQRFTVEPTKSWGDFTTFGFGTVTLPAGTSKITVRPAKVINNLMSLRFVQLVPVK